MVTKCLEIRTHRVRKKFQQLSGVMLALSLVPSQRGANQLCTLGRNFQKKTPAKHFAHHVAVHQRRTFLSDVVSLDSSYQDDDEWINWRVDDPEVSSFDEWRGRTRCTEQSLEQMRGAHPCVNAMLLCSGCHIEPRIVFELTVGCQEPPADHVARKGYVTEKWHLFERLGERQERMLDGHPRWSNFERKTRTIGGEDEDFSRSGDFDSRKPGNVEHEFEGQSPKVKSVCWRCRRTQRIFLRSHECMRRVEKKASDKG